MADKRIYAKFQKNGVDIKDVAFTGSYNDLSDKPSIPPAVAVKGNAESTYRTGNVNLTPANLGLGNVDNTSDVNKPISTATQTALDGKVSKSGDSMTGALAFVDDATSPTSAFVITPPGASGTDIPGTIESPDSFRLESDGGDVDIIANQALTLTAANTQVTVTGGTGVNIGDPDLIGGGPPILIKGGTISAEVVNSVYDSTLGNYQFTSGWDVDFRQGTAGVELSHSTMEIYSQKNFDRTSVKLDACDDSVTIVGNINSTGQSLNLATQVTTVDGSSNTHSFATNLITGFTSVSSGADAHNTIGFQVTKDSTTSSLTLDSYDGSVRLVGGDLYINGTGIMATIGNINAVLEEVL